MQDLEPIILPSVQSAETLVMHLQEKLKDRGQIRVTDLFALLNIPKMFEGNDWGWTNLDGIEISADIRNDNVCLKMPPLTRLPVGWTRPRLAPKTMTVDELIEVKAAELKKIYDEGTAGDKTFEGFLYDYTKLVIGSLASELVEEFLFTKRN